GGRFRGVRAAGLEDGPGRDRGPLPAVRGDDAGGEGGGRNGGLRLHLGLRPLPHRPRAYKGDHLRGVDHQRGAREGHRARQDRPDGHLQRLPKPGPTRQDGLHGGRNEQWASSVRHRGWLVRARVARLRLRLPRGAGEDADVQGGVRDHPPHVHRGRRRLRRRVLQGGPPHQRAQGDKLAPPAHLDRGRRREGHPQARRPLRRRLQRRRRQPGHHQTQVRGPQGPLREREPTLRGHHPLDQHKRLPARTRREPGGGHQGGPRPQKLRRVQPGVHGRHRGRDSRAPPTAGRRRRQLLHNLPAPRRPRAGDGRALRHRGDSERGI
ncbi:MAG: hypothetical protein AVDCRST_MAG01-01-4268, partial [uncultured Rubrobacteraceae bacterium]